MKILCYIFSLIVVVLSFTPCADSGIGSSKQDVFVHNDGNHEENEPLRDLCSPFCQCTCCTAPTVTSLQSVTIIAPYQGEKVYADHLPGNVLKGINSILQPPQLV